MAYSLKYHMGMLPFATCNSRVAYMRHACYTHRTRLQHVAKLRMTHKVTLAGVVHGHVWTCRTRVTYTQHKLFIFYLWRASVLAPKTFVPDPPRAHDPRGHTTLDIYIGHRRVALSGACNLSHLNSSPVHMAWRVP